MTQTTMYAGFVNSPEAKLTAGISSSATTIPVDYLEYFPAAPNVATLGKGPNAETIYYGAKSAASGAGNLTTVTRGWNKTGSVGAAIAWPINTVIARRPTEYDHATFKANIEDLAGLNLALYKGVIDCAANPNYPAANAAEFYIVSVAGKIGGASGAVVTAGDIAICNTDSTSSGTQAAVGAYWDIIQANVDLTLYATLASPTFTGTPAAPTAAADTNTTQIATTAFVLGQAASVNPENIGTTALGSSYRYARRDHVHALSADTPEQGDIVYRGASAFNLLPHSTAYYILRSGGHGANPSWGKIDGGSP